MTSLREQNAAIRRRNRIDKLIFFVTWIVSTTLLGFGLHRVAAGYGSHTGRASFTGHPISDAWAIAIVGGLVLALTVLGIKRGGGR